MSEFERCPGSHTRPGRVQRNRAGLVWCSDCGHHVRFNPITGLLYSHVRRISSPRARRDRRPTLFKRLRP